MPEPTGSIGTIGDIVGVLDVTVLCGAVIALWRQILNITKTLQDEANQRTADQKAHGEAMREIEIEHNKAMQAAANSHYAEMVIVHERAAIAATNKVHLLRTILEAVTPGNTPAVAVEDDKQNLEN